MLDGPLAVSVPPDQTTLQIDNLKPGLTYAFKVSRTNTVSVPLSTELIRYVQELLQDTDPIQLK